MSDTEKGERLFSLHFRKGRDDNSLTVVTKFHKTIGGGELLQTMAHGVRGMIESMIKLGEGYGLNPDQISELIFGGKEEKSDS